MKLTDAYYAYEGREEEWIIDAGREPPALVRYPSGVGNRYSTLTF
jgi:hypothetical protein